MSNQKRIGLEGTIKAYAGCSRIIATIQRASSTELRAESGSGEGQAVLCVQTANRRVSSDLARHGSGCPVLGTFIGIHRTCRIAS